MAGCHAEESGVSSVGDTESHDSHLNLLLTSLALLTSAREGGVGCVGCLLLSLAELELRFLDDRCAQSTISRC